MTKMWPLDFVDVVYGSFMLSSLISAKACYSESSLYRLL